MPFAYGLLMMERGKARFNSGKGLHGRRTIKTFSYIQQYYMQSITFGCDMDDPFFNSLDDAIACLKDEINNTAENVRRLELCQKFYGKPLYTDLNEVSEVIDWESRDFNISWYFRIVIEPGIARLLNDETGEILHEVRF